jgi:hypothetical protein
VNDGGCRSLAGDGGPAERYRGIKNNRTLGAERIPPTGEPRRLVELDVAPQFLDDLGDRPLATGEQLEDRVALVPDRQKDIPAVGEEFCRAKWWVSRISAASSRARRIFCRLRP